MVFFCESVPGWVDEVWGRQRGGLFWPNREQGLPPKAPPYVRENVQVMAPLAFEVEGPTQCGDEGLSDGGGRWIR